jgi:hypothetical protein
MGKRPPRRGTSRPHQPSNRRPHQPSNRRRAPIRPRRGLYPRRTGRFPTISRTTSSLRHPPHP